MSASVDRAGVFLPLAGQRSMAVDQPSSGNDSARVGRREATPSADVIDSQSVLTSESGGIRGFDSGKRINGCKRNIITDTIGLMLFALVHAASIQNRDGAPQLLKTVRHGYPWLRHVFAVGGYGGPKLHQSLTDHRSWTIEIVRRNDR